LLSKADTAILCISLRGVFTASVFPAAAKRAVRGCSNRRRWTYSTLPYHRTPTLSSSTCVTFCLCISEFVEYVLMAAACNEQRSDAHRADRCQYASILGNELMESSACRRARRSASLLHSVNSWTEAARSRNYGWCREGIVLALFQYYSIAALLWDWW